MNSLIQSTCELTMSSVEVAELTNKRHDNVVVDIKKMIRELWPIVSNAPDFTGTYKTKQGNDYRCYNLPKREAMILVSGYSVSLRARIIDRWSELENKQAPQIPQTYSEALRLAADQAEQLAIAAPKVAFVDNLVERSTLMTASQVGQKHKMSAVKLNRFLDELGGVYSKSIKRSRVFCQAFVDGGYGELKQTEQGYSQALFTTAGEQWVNEQLIKEGVI